LNAGCVRRNALCTFIEVALTERRSGCYKISFKAAA